MPYFQIQMCMETWTASSHYTINTYLVYKCNSCKNTPSNKCLCNSLAYSFTKNWRHRWKLIMALANFLQTAFDQSELWSRTPYVNSSCVAYTRTCSVSRATSFIFQTKQNAVRVNLRALLCVVYQGVRPDTTKDETRNYMLSKEMKSHVWIVDSMSLCVLYSIDCNRDMPGSWWLPPRLPRLRI